MKKSVKVKLTGRILLILLAGFAAVMGITYWQVSKILYQNSISAEEMRMEQYLQHVSLQQDSVEIFGKQLASDEVFQSLYETHDQWGIYEQNKKNDEIRRFLKKYRLSRNDCFQIDLVWKDGTYFSSGSTYKASYLENPFFTEFLKSGRRSMYLEEHKITLYNSPRKTETALTYIFTTRCIKDLEREPIYIVLEMDPGDFHGTYAMEDSAVQGFCLSDKYGNFILQSGSFSEKQKNIRLVKTSSNGYWRAELEISGTHLEKQMRSAQIWVLSVSILCCLVILTVLLFSLLRTLKPIEVLKAASREIGKGNLDTKIEIHSEDEFEELGNTFRQMEMNLEAYMKQVIEFEKTKKEMEIDKLVLQINPHFIYNTLNTITYFAEEEGSERIREFTNAFIALLQDSVRQSRKTYFTDLRQEISNLRHYVQLQNYRYEDQFELQIEIEEKFLDCRVPNILLQPIVENALYHGILVKKCRGHIWVDAEKREKDLFIYVKDDGIGMCKETIEEILQEKKLAPGSLRRIGTGNVRNRIRYIYGEAYGLEIKSEVGKGTEVILHLPYEKGECDI